MSEKVKSKKKNKKEKINENEEKEEIKDNIDMVEIYADKFQKMKNKLLGNGSFGEIYLGKNINDNTLVAMKLTFQYNAIQQLNQERIVLESLKNIDGFPYLYGFGVENEKGFLVMEALGPNLTSLFKYCNNFFTLQTVLIIAIQTIELIEKLHNQNFIHRDIKPENFLIGIKEKTNKIYLIDFGLSKKYKDKNNDHIPYKENKKLTGTARYASINSHLGIEESRRDDLESLAYSLIFLLKKSLPWQGINNTQKQEKYNQILEKKLKIPIELICKDIPSKIYLS